MKQRRGGLGKRERVVIVGAGIAGLSAAVLLASAGLQVTVVEQAATPGGKMRQLPVGAGAVNGETGDGMADAGPTVLTMRAVFEDIFARAGTTLDARLTLHPATVLASHAWDSNSRLDLFADAERSAEAIAAFAGPEEGRRYRSFCAEAKRTYDTLEAPFLHRPKASPASLVTQSRLKDVLAIKPFGTLWDALGRHFHDPRLRQLFGRYATYCGSSPFRAPATLMLVAHVEQRGVWTVEGGMHRLAAALAELAQEKGAVFRYRETVERIEIVRGRAAAVHLASGERLEADAVVANADVAALASGRFGTAAARAVRPVLRDARSLSAMTWTLRGRCDGLPLRHHNVFFCRDYKAEFTDIFERGQVPADPTVYLCAQDRDDQGQGAPETGAGERLLLLINAPPDGDVHSYDQAEIEECANRTFAVLERCGLSVTPSPATITATTPADFERLFPATGGALYGRASHGWQATFQRPGVKSRIPGLYLASGSAHPGPGVPMAALSGRLAVESLLQDWGLSALSRPTATPGGTSTP